MCEENSGDEASATGPLRARSPPGTNGGCRHRGLPRAAHVALVPTRNDIAVTDGRTPNYNTEHTLWGKAYHDRCPLHLASYSDVNAGGN